jgi:flagellar secretion chaperone FliS
MRTKGYQNYFDEEVLGASPLRLVELLYRGALESIAAARRYLKLGDIRARSRAVNKAVEIVTELSLALNHQAGGELSRTLAELYAYTGKLLLDANSQQVDPPLAEAERLLATLLEAWTTCSRDTTEPASFHSETLHSHNQQVSYAS